MSDAGNPPEGLPSVDRLLEENEWLRIRVTELSEALETARFAEAELAAVKESRSYRWTAPLRSLLGRFSR